MNKSRETHLVVKLDEGKPHFHQPLKHGHLQVEVPGQVIDCGAGTKLKQKSPHYETLVSSFACQSAQHDVCIFHQVLLNNLKSLVASNIRLICVYSHKSVGEGITAIIVDWERP